MESVGSPRRHKRGELVGELWRYAESHLLGYVRGPESIIIELAERMG